MTRPLALDLFCGAGGVSMGLWRAGFDVIGVDLEPQPNYPFPFVQADALTTRLCGLPAFAWASPPCQDASVGSRRWKAAGRVYPKLIEPTRELLQGLACPWCMENVPGAAIRADLVLVGPMFGLKTWRRRHFELSGFFAMPPAMPPRQGPLTNPEFCTPAGNGGDGPNRASAWAAAMDIDWMTKSELRQAIPPAYAEFIGRAALRYMERKAA